jgi:hypothetical protein
LEEMYSYSYVLVPIQILGLFFTFVDHAGL